MDTNTFSDLRVVKRNEIEKQIQLRFSWINDKINDIDDQIIYHL